MKNSMKKQALLGLLIALAVCGCQVKEDGEFVPEGKVFTATMEAIVDDATDVGTKTSMDANGNVRWKKGDQVSIFVGSTVNQHFQVTDASDGKTAAALNQVESSGFVAGSEISNNVAFYPYSSTAEIAKNGNSYVISDIALSATQNYANASFGNGAFPMTAVTSSKSDYNLKFKNVLGGLKLQLKGTAAIASISVTGNNNEKICGAAEVTVLESTTPSISLIATDSKTVTLDCGDGVQLDANTATAFIIALPPMTMSDGFTAIVTDTEGATMEIKTTKTQTITRSSLLKMPALNYVGTVPVLTPVPEAVDLGLPSGLKWASCNLGASAPEEYGDYYAWGDTEPNYTSQSPLTWKDGKTGYNSSSYKFQLGTDWRGPFSKYVTESSYGTVDGKTILDLEDDAAHVKLCGGWRMPSDSEWTELRIKCTWTWIMQNGVYGMLVTGPNGNTIFLPAAGGRNDTYIYSAGSSGDYWSSSLYATGPYYAWYAYFNSDEVDRGYYRSRFLGLPVRPVALSLSSANPGGNEDISYEDWN